MFKNLLLYLISLIVMGYLTLMYNEYHMSVLFFILIVFFIILFLIVVLSIINLKVTVDVDSRLVNKDEEFKLIITVDNKSIFPIPRVDLYLESKHMFDKYGKKEKIKIAMDKKNKQTVITSLCSNCSGVIQLKVSKVRVFDLLYIISLYKKYNKKIELVTLPEYKELELSIKDNPYYVADDGEIIDEKGDDPSQVFAIRDYIEGDRPSRIHHKLSYKYDSLMVKDFSAVKSMKKLIIVDISVDDMILGDYRTMDRIFRTVYSCAIEELNLADEIWISYGSSKGVLVDFHVRSEEELYACMEDVILSYGKIAFNKVKSNKYKSILEHHIGGSSQYSHINYITNVIQYDTLSIWWEQEATSMLNIIYVNPYQDRLFEKEKVWDILANTSYHMQEDRIQIIEIGYEE